MLDALSRCSLARKVVFTGGAGGRCQLALFRPSLHRRYESRCGSDVVPVSSATRTDISGWPSSPPTAFP